jgi:hypothetical protein
LIEYTTAILLILITYAVAVINIKFDLFTYIIILVDIFTIVPDVILGNGSVIVGYSWVNSVLTPLVVSFSWLRIVSILGMAACIITAIMKETGSF